MPTISQSLQGKDLGHLRILAEHWGVELFAPDARKALSELTEALLNPELVSEVVTALSGEGRKALIALIQNEARIPWAQFTRQFGELRAVGPGRRDRERPDREPISPAEELWYRAIIARAFFDTTSGAQEFAYIPDDLYPLIPALSEPDTHNKTTELIPQLGRVATPEERAEPVPADDRILDHICTLLAAHRLQIDPTSQFPASPQVPGQPDLLLNFSTTLLHTSNLLSPTGNPDLESTRKHLESPRNQALAQLVDAWVLSAEHNDLHHVPHLNPEGEWRNDPLATRQFIIGLLSALPGEKWWSISAFIADLRRDFPDFQRPASDYDSWFIRDNRSGEFLRGFENWDNVDGNLVRYLITGPLHWLGIIDLAYPVGDFQAEDATACRRSKWASYLLESNTGIRKPDTPPNFMTEDSPIHVRSNGQVNIPFMAPRTARYQIARFCHWESPTSHEYRYRFTPGSLTQAINQGLKIKHLQTLLARHTQNVPPNIVKALSRWDQRGTEARLQTAPIIRLGSPELLKALRNSRASRYLGEPLGPTTLIVKPGAEEKVLEILMEMGYLGEVIHEI